MFHNIPDEMKQYNQFVCWRYEDMQGGKPTKVPYCPHNGKLASVRDSSTWASFQDAVDASPNYSGIGFVLSENDPYTFIDLDDPYELNADGSPKFPNAQEILDRQLNVFNKFDSFSEKSPSGKGLHIIVKAGVTSGRKRSAIEVYSSLRYMTMTGNVYKAAPIVERQELINILWEQLGKGAAIYNYEGDTAETYTDEQILTMGMNAANGQKFMDLFDGKWQAYYQDSIDKVSCNEADFALVDMLAFYTQNTAQITRLFHRSVLANRAKAHRIDYVQYMISRCFDRMLPPVDIDGLKNQLEAAIAENKARSYPERTESENCLKNRLPNLQSDGTLELDPTLTLPKKAATKQHTDTVALYAVPPGLMGLIAQFIHQSAPRQVPEIALAGAIGLMAGICGRSYNISGTGLNQYVLVLAQTGAGKEAIASGIDKLMLAVQRTVPAAVDFIGPAEIASPQALAKHLAKSSPCFFSMVGEFGLKLQQMAAFRADKNDLGLQRMMLDLYNKSGEGKVLRGTIRSDREQNTDAVLSPSFTIMGESAPENFYKALNESMIESGLLPRFTIIEYHGLVPLLNDEHLHVQPSFDLVEQTASLCAHSLMLNNGNKAQHVSMTPEVVKMFKELDAYCVNENNNASNEVVRHLWTRCAMKTMKLSALVAVGVNPYEPVITLENATWAFNIIKAGIVNILVRFESGNIGEETSETKQMDDVCRVIKSYIVSDWTKIEKYKASNIKLHDDKIITLTYINKRLSSSAAFRKDKLGATKAIQRTVETLKAQGDIREVGPKQAADKYGFSGKCFAIVNVVQFGL